jgi:hypothetical protein
MRDRHGMKQSEVASNLDYLIQVGWVRPEVKSRSFVTGKGMVLDREQTKYKVSELGINRVVAQYQRAVSCPDVGAGPYAA